MAKIEQFGTSVNTGTHFMSLYIQTLNQTGKWMTEYIRIDKARTY